MKKVTENVFGSRIRDLRRKQHLTQAEFAKRIFVVKSNVSRWERGYCMPSLATVKLICNTFDVSADWLLGTTWKGAAEK